MSTLTDDEQEAIWHGWSEMYRAQDEAEAERLGAWCCPVDRTMVPLGENCSECGCHPSTCECPDCEPIGCDDEPEVLWEGELSAWLCPSCGVYTEGECHCSNCGGQAPWGCDCGLRDDIELRDEDEQELEYMPIEMTLGRYEWLAPWEDVYEPEHIRPGGVTRDESNDEWTDEHERDDSEGWDEEE